MSVLVILYQKKLQPQPDNHPLLLLPVSECIKMRVGAAIIPMLQMGTPRLARLGELPWVLQP